MYEQDMIPPVEHGTSRMVVDSSIFEEFILPLSTRDQSPNEGKRHSQPSGDGQSPDSGIKPIPKAISKLDAPSVIDWYGLHQGAHKTDRKTDDSSLPLSNFDSDNFKADKETWLEARIKHATRQSDLKTGEEAVKDYIRDIPKLVLATSENLNTEFELHSLLKGTSLSATATRYYVPQPVFSSQAGVTRPMLVFEPKDANWVLYVKESGEATALKLNARSGKMESVPAGPVIEQVTMTMRAAMAIKCFRDGDVDAGRAQLKTLLEDGIRFGAEERLKKIIQTEADLIYKPARLRAVTRDDFNKILTETQRSLSERKKR